MALLRPGPAGPEVLLTHRPATMAFGPGLHVFPGGAVDTADGDPRLLDRCVLGPDGCAAAWGDDLAPAAAAVAAIAAIRELYEEVGVLLASLADGGAPDPAVIEASRRAGVPFGDLVVRHDLRLRTDRLVPLSRWVTPPVGLPRRYDARVFVAELPGDGPITHDRREVAAHAWLRPRDALAAMADGRLTMWTPTATTLQQLEPVRGLADVRASLSPLERTTAPTATRVMPAVVRVRLGGAGGVPGNRVDTWVVGRGRAVVVDPGDPNDAGVEAILAAAAAGGARIVAVLLTSAAPDHAAGATSVAARVGVPVMASPGAARVLADPIEPLDEGALPDLADTPIRVVPTPGTRPDHLAYDLPELDAVLTGDLDGGPSRGVPVIADEAALRESLGRVAALGRRVRLPAHGDDHRPPGGGS